MLYFTTLAFKGATIDSKKPTPSNCNSPLEIRKKHERYVIENGISEGSKFMTLILIESIYFQFLVSC